MGLASGDLLVFPEGKGHHTQVHLSNGRTLPRLDLLTTLPSFGYLWGGVPSPGAQVPPTCLYLRIPMPPERSGEEARALGRDWVHSTPPQKPIRPWSARPGFCVRRALLPPPPSALSLRLAWISPLVFPAAQRQLSPSRAQRGPTRPEHRAQRAR